MNICYAVITAALSQAVQVIENNKNVIILTTMTSSRDKFLVVDIN
jgi:hypothetical protein